MPDDNGNEMIKVDEPIDPAEAVFGVQDTLEKFIEIADVGRVFGAPIRRGDVTVIPTAEVLAGLGFGMGYGGGTTPAEDGETEQRGGGGGGGGGGRILSRPVAVIVVDPSGVRVEPIVDQTKIGLAALTAAGFILTTLFRMMRGSSDEG
jgi:uncharacterized spore protein YtfJ